MRVLSVNVAVPTTLSLATGEVASGIDKRPRRERVRVEADGLAGDFRVERRRYGDPYHAVHMYPAEHYRAWADELQLTPYPYGFLGENLTTEGLSESDLHLGDRLRVGTALLEVSQPRIPCRKLDARVGFKFARRFLTSCRVGLYLRVLEPGEVWPDAPIVREHHARDAPTIRDFVRLTKRDHWDYEALEALLHSPALPPGWADLITTKVERAEASRGWLGLRDLEIVRVERFAAGRVLSLRCARGRRLPAPPQGRLLPLCADPSGRNEFARHGFPLLPMGPSHTHYEIAMPWPPPTPFEQLDPEVGGVLRAGAPTAEFPIVAPPDARTLAISVGVGAAVFANRWNVDAPLPSEVRWLRADGGAEFAARVAPPHSVGDNAPEQFSMGSRDALTTRAVEVVREARRGSDAPLWALLAGPRDEVEPLADELLRMTDGPHLVRSIHSP